MQENRKDIYLAAIEETDVVRRSHTNALQMFLLQPWVGIESEHYTHTHTRTHTNFYLFVFRDFTSILYPM